MADHSSPASALSLLGNRLQRLPLPLALISALLFLFTLGQVLFFSADAGKKSVVLLLGAALFFNSCGELPETRQSGILTSRMEKCVAWFFLLSIFPLHVLDLFFPGAAPGGFLKTLPALLFFLAAFCYWGGLRNTLIFLLPALVCTMILPNRETLALMLSYPLRLLSTILSAGTLRLCGFAIEYHLTSIRLPDSGIAITDACSGIEQLEILLLLGYLLVKMQHTGKIWAFLHYLFILPAVIVVNSFRIIVTILLFHFHGQVAFSDPVHITLGCLLVIAVILLLWFLGYLFPDASRENPVPPQPEKPAGQEQEHP